MKDISPFPESVRLEFGDGSLVELDPQTIRALTHLAVKYEVGIGTAIVQAVADEKFLLDLESQGHQLLIEQSDGALRKLVRSSD